MRACVFRAPTKRHALPTLVESAGAVATLCVLRLRLHRFGTTSEARGQRTDLMMARVWSFSTRDT